MDLLHGPDIEGGRFKNLDYSKKTIKAKTIVDTTFTRCVFAEAVFQECLFHNCVFEKCDLSMLQVKNSQFTGVQFDSCKMMGINWTEAAWQKGGLLRPISFHDCTLNYASFFGLKLKDLKLTHCVAREVDFGEADLTGGVFAETDFAGSIFMHTNLTEADFTSAANYRISPSDNVLKKTKFSLPEAISLLYALDIILVEH